MKKEIYGCACCSPEFGNIFHGNKIVAELSTMNPSDVARHRNQPFWQDKLDRRTFVKGSLIAAGTTALLPGLSLAQHSEPVTVFTGGTILSSP